MNETEDETKVDLIYLSTRECNTFYSLKYNMLCSNCTQTIFVIMSRIAIAN